MSVGIIDTERIRSQNGFTAIDLLVAVIIGFVLLFGISRIFIGSLNSFTAQEQMNDLQHSTQAAAEALMDVIMQAGADLPRGDTVITSSSNGDFSIIVNPNAAYYQFTTDIAPSVIIPVSRARNFLGETTLYQSDEGDPPTITLLSVDVTHTAPSFTDFYEGIDTLHDQICFTAPVAFSAGDVLYVRKINRYYLDSVGRSIVLQQNGGTGENFISNIDTLSVRFLTLSNPPIAATTWASMRTCIIKIIGRSPVLDKKYLDPIFGDHYRRCTIQKSFLLRNNLPD